MEFNTFIRRLLKSSITIHFCLFSVYFMIYLYEWLNYGRFAYNKRPESSLEINTLVTAITKTIKIVKQQHHSDIIGKNNNH